MNIYVGNLSYDITDEQLRTEFSAFGSVSKVSIIADRDTGRPRGFGFVEMDDAGQARSAIAALNGKEVAGRALSVNEAKPRTGGGGSRGSRY